MPTRPPARSSSPASHNPPEWNGFKYKPEYGGSASPEIIAAVEREIHAVEAGGPPAVMPLDDARRDGIVTMIDPRPLYMDRLHSLVDVERIKAAGLRVVIDPMYGAGIGYVADMLSGGANGVDGDPQRAPTPPSPA